MNYPTDDCIMALGQALQDLAGALCETNTLPAKELFERMRRGHNGLRAEGHEGAAVAYEALMDPVAAHFGQRASDRHLPSWRP